MKKELTKGDIYVVVDTPKKAKKLKNVLDMFGEQAYEGRAFHDDGYPYYTYISEFNWFEGCRHEMGSNLRCKTKVSIKELRNILAKEHLKVGDYVVLNSNLKGKIVRFIGDSEILILDYENDKVTCSIEDFKRYATPDEVALLEPKSKELGVGKWFLFSGHTVKHKPLMLITKNNGSTVRFCGFNFEGKWVDNDLYTLEVLKTYGYTEATPQKVETDLVNEAKNRGHKYDVYSWNHNQNILYAHRGDNEGHHIIFENGVWSDVIEDKLEYRIKSEEKPKVGDVCKFWNSDEKIYSVGVLIKDATGSLSMPYITRCGYYKNAKKLSKQEAIDLLFGKEGSTND